MNKENRGSLWKNDYKEKDSQPDMTGKINVEGEEFKISGWKDKTKEGKPYISIAISRPKQSQRPAESVADTESDDFDF